jgi:hypothetical protein
MVGADADADGLEALPSAAVIEIAPNSACGPLCRAVDAAAPPTGQPAPLPQLFTRDDPPRSDKVRALSAIATLAAISWPSRLEFGAKE